MGGSGITPPGLPRFISVEDWRDVAVPRQLLRRPFNPSTYLIAQCFLFLVPVAHTPPPTINLGAPSLFPD